MAKKPFNKESEKRTDTDAPPPGLDQLLQALQSMDADAQEEDAAPLPNPAYIPTDETLVALEGGDADEAQAAAALRGFLSEIENSTSATPLVGAELDAWLKNTRTRFAEKDAARAKRQGEAE